MPSKPFPITSDRCLRRRMVLIVVGFATMVVLSFFSRRTPVPEDVADRPTVACASLSLRDGRLFLDNATNPFSGWMWDHYPDGTLRSRSEVSNGVLHGWSEGWHTNGQIQVREQFSRGVSDGTRTKWYASGAKLSEAAIVNGRLDGRFRRWHENGQLAEEATLRDGKPDGVARAWYSDGNLRAEVNVNNGEVLKRNF
ncbi:MAG: toxin-antitoxin system YwqK family antitoxin [Verrucomicrobiales bacterium]|nr:toxin-antitoxin system YwqK family antitoxin [Verrucomicrobiales bacterium]